MADKNPTQGAIESALSTLQPIRDLSRNWDVDIASCLEEYLHEIAGLSGAQIVQVEKGDAPTSSSGQDGQVDIPNFAQAAIILQNSSHVYSRKVEYLHGLVYKALYEFFKSTSATSKESRRKSADPSIDDFYEFDANEDFLLLDDVIPEDFSNTKINLKEDNEEVNLLSGSGTPLNQSLTRTRLSLGGLSITRAERSSLGGVASSSQQRALLGTLNNSSLRLVDGLCDVGDDGVLLMPGSQNSAPPGSDGLALDTIDGAGRSLFGEDSSSPEDFKPQNGDEFDDHSNDGAGFAMNDDDDGPAPMQEDLDVEIGVSDHHSAEGVQKRVTFAETAIVQKRVDPWALLDPHSSKGFTSKPLRKGKTYRLPEGIDLPPSECVTGASTRRVIKRTKVKSMDESPKSIILESFQAILGGRDELPPIPVDGLAFGDEFLYVAKKHAKARAAKQREERKKLSEEQNTAQAQAQVEYQDDDDDDNGAGFDFGGGYDDDDNDDYDGVGNAGVSSLDDAYHGDRAGDDSNLGKTFEELCRAHIKAFAKGAEDFAFNTKLTERVSMWQARLAPILEEEERRAAFDIHRYSEDLLKTAKQGLQRIKRKSDGSEHAASTTVHFDAVTKNCTQSDVCRLFLASLSLANSGNIYIQEGTSMYTFDLVSGNVERPMETYRAPSVAENA